MDGDGGGLSAPQPMAGMGNYKGVMLCTRPPDDGSRGQGLDGGKKPEFKSTVAASCGEKVGWAPPKRHDENRTEIKKCGPSAALRRHVQWIKELQEQVKADRQQLENGNVDEEERRKKLQVAFKKQRDAIRKIKAEAASDQAGVQPQVLEAILKPAPQGRSKAAGAGASSKPLWAMTSDEKDEFEEAQAADLINFAEGLDFDRYIDDLEFRQCLQVVQDRAKKLQKEQDAFKDSLVREFEQLGDGSEGEGEEEEDGYSDIASSAGGQSGIMRRRRAAKEGKPDWDASTSCGDDLASVDGDARSVAGSILESNPQIRGVHSKQSVQKLVEKAAQMQRISEEA